jgi:hypothetical protein
MISTLPPVKPSSCALNFAVLLAAPSASSPISSNSILVERSLRDKVFNAVDLLLSHINGTDRY